MSQESLTINHLLPAEQCSTECRKTKTKVINLANHKGQRQYNEPIKTRINKLQVADTKRGKTSAGESQLVLVFLVIG